MFFFFSIFTLVQNQTHELADHGLTSRACKSPCYCSCLALLAMEMHRIQTKWRIPTQVKILFLCCFFFSQKLDEDIRNWNTLERLSYLIYLFVGTPLSLSSCALLTGILMSFCRPWALVFSIGQQYNFFYEMEQSEFL